MDDKKYRTQSGQYVLEGDKMVREALDAGTNIRELFATEEWLTKNNHQLSADIRCTEILPSELTRISFQKTPNQVLALIQLPSPEEHPVVDFAILLDTLQDPGNMGSIVRIADWFGIPHVFLHGACADPYSPKAVQASMGSILRVKVAAVEGERFLQQYPNIPRMAATLQGEALEKFGKTDRGILVIGNESKGVSAGLLAHCSVQLSISGRGGAESLNAAVATGILCHALLC